MKARVKLQPIGTREYIVEVPIRVKVEHARCPDDAKVAAFKFFDQRLRNSTAFPVMDKTTVLPSPTVR